MNSTSTEVSRASVALTEARATAIGSEGYVAVKNGRRFVGVELKPSYFALAERNLEIAERDAKSGTLFDLLP